MKSFSYTIKDKTGIHARPAGLVAKLAKSFKSNVTIEKGEKSVNAEKLMMLMSMGVKFGDTVRITVDGEDEDEAFEKIKSFFEGNL